MKPEIGTRVYCIYDDGIFVDTVGYIGDKSFIIESFGGSTYENSWEWHYEDFGTKWFVELEAAKRELLSKYGNGFKIEIVTDDWFQLFYEDEE